MNTELLRDIQEKTKDAFEYFNKVIQTYNKIKNEIDNDVAFKDDLKDALLCALIEAVIGAKSLADCIYVKTDSILSKIKE